MNSADEYYADEIVKTIETDLKRKICEEVRQALDDKETEIRVDGKSLRSVRQATKNLSRSIGK